MNLDWRLNENFFFIFNVVKFLSEENNSEDLSCPQWYSGKNKQTKTNLMVDGGGNEIYMKNQSIKPMAFILGKVLTSDIIKINEWCSNISNKLHQIFMIIILTEYVQADPV